MKKSPKTFIVSPLNNNKLQPKHTSKNNDDSSSDVDVEGQKTRNL